MSKNIFMLCFYLFLPGYLSAPRVFPLLVPFFIHLNIFSTVKMTFLQQYNVYHSLCCLVWGLAVTL